MAEKGDVLLTEGSERQHGADDGDSRPVDIGEPLFGDTEELKTLIAQGQEKGYLTFEQIASTLEEVEVTKEQVQGLHAYLIEHGIDVIGEDGLTAYKEAKGDGRGRRSPSWT